MSRNIVNAFVMLFSGIGLFFFIAGTVGLLRCPDLYARLHPSTKCDTLGACSFAFALCLYAGFSFLTLKLITIVFFLLLASATCGHAIGRSAFRTHVMPWHKPGVTPWPEEGEGS